MPRGVQVSFTVRYGRTSTKWLWREKGVGRREDTLMVLLLDLGWGREVLCNVDKLVQAVNSKPARPLDSVT